ncbi:hypothetical protein DPMN_099724 [Dreissena polymorpha]|uniref:Uncharacterized protein n=1 Tax=Dreissena polymorpha TaxID=45954 RepID=A0A9D4LG16_DREPO|nr:hypothetical protein DPMN_099724 [Dreissena polymorpha]
MHQKSDPFVGTMFSEDVELVMQTNGDLEEAHICRLFREWHDTEDKAGIPPEERVKRSLSFIDWLM